MNPSRLRSVSGLYIEESFKCNYISYQATIHDLEIQYKNENVWITLKTIQNVVSETEYTFTSTELDTLYTAFPNTDTISLRFTLKSYLHSRQQAVLTPVSTITKTFYITYYEFNWDPPGFVFEDINAVTTALTGNNSILIKGYSTIEYTIPENYKPTAIKSASIDYYKFKNSNGEYITVDETSGQINGPSCTNYNQDYFEVIAVDTRGFEVYRSLSPYLLIDDYYAPSASLEFERIDSVGEGGLINLYISYWYGNFAGSSDTTKENTIKSVYYRVKPVNGSFSDWVDITSSMTISNGIASASDLRIYYNGNNFDIGTSYVVEIKAVDGTSAQDFNEISGVTATLSDGTVLDSYYKDTNGNYKYAINKLVDKNGATLQVNGDLSVDGYLRLYNQNNGLLIGDLNSSYIHFYSNQDKPFYFNRSVEINGELKVKGANLSNTLYGFIYTDKTIPSGNYTEIDNLTQYFNTTNGKLSISNGKIKVGSGVSLLKVSFNIGLNIANQDTLYSYLTKNSSNTGLWLVKYVQGAYDSVYRQDYIEVAENDEISCSVYLGNGGTVASAGRTNFTVEIIK